MSIRGKAGAAALVFLIGALVGVRSSRAQSAALATAAPGTTLGPYEMEAVAEGLQNHGFEVERDPEGKRVGAIFVHNAEVFAREEGWLQFFNNFHRTTRDHIIAREVLLRPGDPWDTVIALESRRRLLDESVSNLVVVVPVKAGRPDLVNILVVTRDIWSLRLNTDFEFQGDVLSRLVIQPSENNLFGWRKRLSLVFDMSLGRYSLGPTYSDPNIAGTRWRLDASARLLVGRDSGDAEGSTSSLVVRHPLWAYSRKWGGGFSFAHGKGIARGFAGSSPCIFTGDPLVCGRDPALGVPVRYRYADLSGSAFVDRQFRGRFVHIVGLSHNLSNSTRDAIADDFVARPDLLMPFVDGILPRSERISALRLSYDLVTPNFVTLRDITTFDFAEDVAPGPRFSVDVARAIKALGSQNEFWSAGASASYIMRIGTDGYGFVHAAAGTRLQGGNFIDNSFSGDVWLATPTFARVLRLVLRADGNRLLNNRSTRFLTLGGEDGLRGYAIDTFRGQIRVRGNAELRTRGLRAGFLRIGTVLFWDAGHAAATIDALDLHHDFGFGLRIVVPQAQRSVIRLDWAFANRHVFDSSGALLTEGGWPGRFSAGFSQAF